MLVSVFTPSNDPKFLDDCYKSLDEQTYYHWQWVVLLNNGAKWECTDPRVKLVYADELTSIGALKRTAVANCEGSILVELDHDDLLDKHALRQVVSAFEKNPDAGLIYSHCANIDSQGNPLSTPFAEGNGWRYRKTGDYTYPITPEATPHNVSYIWYAPNHLRAFTTEAYDAVGGYDATRDVLDDQELMGRLYKYGEFILINKCLYYQRVHEGNAQSRPDLNARIQIETVELYDKQIEENALAWADRNGLIALDLGSAHNKPKGYVGVDQHSGSDIQHIFPAKMDIPDSSVGVIRAVDFLEHVADKVGMMNEIHRLLAPGGMLLSMTPSTDGRGAWQDPTHVAGWNQNSFWYYTEEEYAKFVPEITARFQSSRVFTSYPTPWHAEHDISYVTANLIAIKPGMPRNHGKLYWS